MFDTFTEFTVFKCCKSRTKGDKKITVERFVLRLVAWMCMSDLKLGDSAVSFWFVVFQ